MLVDHGLIIHVFQNSCCFGNAGAAHVVAAWNTAHIASAFLVLWHIVVATITLLAIYVAHMSVWVAKIDSELVATGAA